MFESSSTFIQPQMNHSLSPLRLGLHRGYATVDTLWTSSPNKIASVSWLSWIVVCYLASLCATIADDTSSSRVTNNDDSQPRLFLHQASATNSRLEQFKAFISSPPPISNLLFKQKVPMGGARPLDGTFSLSTSFEYFQARWQTNGFLFRKISSPLDATNFTVAGHLVSRSGHESTLFEPIPLLTTWDDRDPSVKGQRYSIFYTSHFFLDSLCNVLNMGIMYAEIGGIRWHGNRFETECEVDNEHLRISGEVIVSSLGLVDHLYLTYAFPHESYDYIIRYGYSSRSALSYLPMALTNFWLPNRNGTNRTEVDINEWEILDIQFAKQPLAPEAFDVKPFLSNHQWPTRIYTNGGFYIPMANGSLRLVGGLLPFHSEKHAANGVSVAWLYWSWAVFNLCAFALAWTMRANERDQKPNDTKERKIDEEQSKLCV